MKKSFGIIVLLLLAFGLGYGFKAATTHSSNSNMKKVTGIGGIFFKSDNPAKLKEWYQTNLGLVMDQYGTSFNWREGADSSKLGLTQWSAFSAKTTYFEPSTKDFMINYRVANLEALMVELQANEVTIVDELQDTEYGKFLHILDNEGNKIELWEPVETEYNAFIKEKSK